MGLIPMQGGFGMSPEDFQKQQEDARAAAHEQRDRIFRFLTEMKPEDLGTFIEMLIMFAEQGDTVVHGYLGMATGIMRVKHDRCPCGEDHNAEILNAEKAKLDSEKPIDGDINPDEVPPGDDEATLAAMKEYGVIRGEDGLLHCKGCSALVTSMEDRMLRKRGKDGCITCQQKDAWG